MKRYSLVYPSGNYKSFRYRDNEDPKRRKRSLGTRNEREAKRLLRELEKKDVKITPTLGNFAKPYFKFDECPYIKMLHRMGKNFSEDFAAARRGHLDNYILKKFGNKYLADINNAAQIEKWLLSLNLSNQTLNHIKYTFKIVMEEAEREGLINNNPLLKVRRFSTHVAKKKDILTPQELAKAFPNNLIKLSGIWKRPLYGTLFQLLLTSGLRTGEARALKWKHFDKGNKLVTVCRAMKNKNEIGLPKNGKTRIIRIPSHTVLILEEYRALSCYNEEEDFIFPGRNPFHPISKEAIIENFRKGLDRASISVEQRNLVPHSLRHTYNTVSVTQLPGDVVRQLTGHSDEKMTEHYNHVDLSQIGMQINDQYGAVIDGLWDLKQST